MPDHPEESWDSWIGRVAAELAVLAGGGFATYAALPDSHASGDGTAHARKGWRRRRPSRMTSASGTSQTAAPPASEVLLQARVLEGMLALECISDTEFEGVSDLSTRQQRELVALGWEQDGLDPTFSRTYSLEESRAAADLLARSLRGVLGADRPSQVDTRHA